MKKVIGLAVLAVLLSFVVPAHAEVTVEEGVVCTAVVDRKPEGAAATFPADTGRLYAFTRIKGAQAASSVTHRWVFAGKTVAEVKLDVKGSPYRVWSSKLVMPSQKGAWKVEVVDDAGTVLKTLEFSVGLAAGGAAEGPKPAEAPKPAPEKK